MRAMMCPPHPSLGPRPHVFSAAVNSIRQPPRKFIMPRTKIILGICLLAGCSSSAVLAGAPSAPCAARSLGFDQKDAGWKHQPMSRLKRDTRYSVVQDGDRRAVLRAAADGSASLYVAALKPALGTPMSLSWEWKTDSLVPGADNRDKSREDAPLRVLVAFDGDLSTLPEAEQARFKRAKSLSGRQPPYAVLMYIWTDQVAVGTVIPSAHTSQVKMLAVESGSAGLGKWQAVKRNLVDDYRRVYGAEPGPVLGIAVMTDTDNTGTKATGDYSDIRITCAGG
jgi:Protein of unknown function (DUF3047)